MLLSGSRDKSLIIWNLTRDEQNYGYPKRSLHGHSHIVSDCVCDNGSQSYDGSRADSHFHRSSLLTVLTLYLPRGTRPFDSGNSQLVRQHVASLGIPMMFYRSLSPLTTGKLSLARGIVQSSYGTPWETANLPLLTKDTPNGSPVYGSAQTPRTRLL